MPKTMHLYLKDETQETLRSLATRWGLSDSATIALALKRAEVDFAPTREDQTA